MRGGTTRNLAAYTLLPLIQSWNWTEKKWKSKQLDRKKQDTSRKIILALTCQLCIAEDQVIREKVVMKSLPAFLLPGHFHWGRGTTGWTRFFCQHSGHWSLQVIFRYTPLRNPPLPNELQCYTCPIDWQLYSDFIRKKHSSTRVAIGKTHTRESETND